MRVFSPASVAPFASVLLLAACSSPAVQGSGTESGTDSGTAASESGASTSTTSTSSTTSTTTSTSTGGACIPGMSIACTCPNGESGAQVCNPDGKSLGPCSCEGGSASDSQGNTTTTDASGTSAGPGTSGPDASTGAGSSTGGVMCDDPGPEPNEDEPSAVDLGDQGCQADAKTFMGVLAGDADVDWFSYHGVYQNCGLFPPDPTAAQIITANDSMRLCVFVECDMGPVDFQCDGGAVKTDSPGGRPGCCNQDDVKFVVNCTDTGNESARVYVRLDQGPKDVCASYSVEYSYLAN